MNQILSCITHSHDHRLLLLSFFICLVGSLATMQLFISSRFTSGVTRIGWLALTSLAIGATVWCTHFVGMMAYRPTVPVTLDLGLTAVSLLIAVVGSVPGLIIALCNKRLFSCIGGCLVGAAASAMHYTGMAAYKVDGLVEWNENFIVTSVVTGCILSTLAFLVLCDEPSITRKVCGAFIFALSIIGLHFIGMSAATIIPLRFQDGAALSDTSMSILAISTACGGLVIIGCAAVSAVINAQAQTESYRRLYHIALHDSLTGLPNRVSFTKTLRRHIGLTLSQGRSLAVIMFDLTNFKGLNECYGHQGGDQVLAAVGARIAERLVGRESVARLSGDEFAVSMHYNDRYEIDEFIKRLSTVFDKPFIFENFSTVCSAAVGVALAPENGTDPDTILANADLAMYRAKGARSHSPCFFDTTMDDKLRKRRDVSAKLRNALTSNEFQVHYQVQVCLETGHIEGYEALLRWKHPMLGQVGPDIFIPLAEEIGVTGALGNWVLSKACSEAAAWPEKYSIAVNLSPLQLADPLLASNVRSALIESGLNPTRLELELTESAIISDRIQALKTLHDIKSLGVSIALDDFGVGYSSLEVLRSFPFDKIKLDRSFVAEIDSSRQAEAILRSISRLGSELKIKVLAEGIETLHQLQIVKRFGCSSVQGYLLGKPSRQLVDPVSLCHVMNDTISGFPISHFKAKNSH